MYLQCWWILVTYEYVSRMNPMWAKTTANQWRPHQKYPKFCRSPSNLSPSLQTSPGDGRGRQTLIQPPCVSFEVPSSSWILQRPTTWSHAMHSLCDIIGTFFVYSENISMLRSTPLQISPIEGSLHCWRGGLVVRRGGGLLFKEG